MLIYCLPLFEIPDEKTIFTYKYNKHKTIKIHLIKCMDLCLKPIHFYLLLGVHSSSLSILLYTI